MVHRKIGGYHRIDEIYDDYIEDEPGVYLFYQTRTGPVRYVGRSDSQLYTRIRGRDYRYYRYKHCHNAKEAYYWECEYYHRYYDDIDNDRHPGKPRYSNCSCHCCDN